MVVRAVTVIALIIAHVQHVAMETTPIRTDFLAKFATLKLSQLYMQSTVFFQWRIRQWYPAGFVIVAFRARTWRNYLLQVYSALNPLKCQPPFSTEPSTQVHDASVFSAIRYSLPWSRLAAIHAPTHIPYTRTRARTHTVTHTHTRANGQTLQSNISYLQSTLSVHIGWLS